MAKKGLRRHLRIDARRSQHLQLFNSMPVGGLHNAQLDQQVIAQKIYRISAVGQNSAHLCRRQKNLFWPLRRKKLIHRCRIPQIQFATRPQQKICIFGFLQSPHDGGAHHAAMTCDKNGVALKHAQFRGPLHDGRPWLTFAPAWPVPDRAPPSFSPVVES